MFTPLGVGVGVYSLLVVVDVYSCWAAAVGLRTSFCTRNHRLLASVVPFCTGLQVPVVVCVEDYQVCSCSLLWPFVTLCMVQQLLFYPVCYSFTSFPSGSW